MPPIKSTVEVHGPALRELRIRSGLGTEELAEMAGVKRPYITKLELGHSRRVSPRVFQALLSALSIKDRRALLADPFGASEDAA